MLATLVVLVALGWVHGHDVVRENAQNSNARELVLRGVGMVEAFAGTHGGHYPGNGSGETFTHLWQAQFPITVPAESVWSFDRIPVLAPAVRDLRPVPGSASASADAWAGSPTALGLERDPARAGQLVYVPIIAGPQGGWSTFQDGQTGQKVVVTRYALGLYGRDGTPWWVVKGGQ